MLRHLAHGSNHQTHFRRAIGKIITKGSQYYFFMEFFGL